MRPIILTKRFQVNNQGRDFVAGDIHGCFRTLDVALETVGFNAGKDRLFSVGDLIDRGPHSLEAIEWLRDKQIQGATMGNHENALLAYLWYVGHRSAYEQWWREIGILDRPLWISMLRGLPVAMSIQTQGSVTI